MLCSFSDVSCALAARTAFLCRATFTDTRAPIIIIYYSHSTHLAQSLHLIVLANLTGGILATCNFLCSFLQPDLLLVFAGGFAVEPVFGSVCVLCVRGFVCVDVCVRDRAGEFQKGTKEKRERTQIKRESS